MGILHILCGFYGSVRRMAMDVSYVIGDFPWAKPSIGESMGFPAARPCLMRLLTSAVAQRYLGSLESWDFVFFWEQSYAGWCFGTSILLSHSVENYHPNWLPFFRLTLPTYESFWILVMNNLFNSTYLTMFWICPEKMQTTLQSDYCEIYDLGVDSIWYNMVKPVIHLVFDVVFYLMCLLQ